MAAPRASAAGAPSAGTRSWPSRDYEARTARSRERRRGEPLSLPKSNVLAFELEGGSRIIARPSGTEPKIKFYFDVREPVENGEPLAQVEARANATMEGLKKVFVAFANGEGEQGGRA